MTKKRKSLFTNSLKSRSALSDSLKRMMKDPKKENARFEEWASEHSEFCEQLEKKLPREKFERDLKELVIARLNEKGIHCRWDPSNPTVLEFLPEYAEQVTKVIASCMEELGNKT